MMALYGQDIATNGIFSEIKTCEACGLVDTLAAKARGFVVALYKK